MLDLSSVRTFIDVSPPSSAVYVGCDSKRHHRDGRWIASYARVVVIHKESRHGCRVFGEVLVRPDFGSLHQRLMQEVYLATEVAGGIVDVIGPRPFEVHLDLNPSPRHRSNMVVREATGYVRGVMGFEPVLKPDSIASTAAADMFAAKLLAA